MKPNLTVQSITTFEKRFGQPHLNLAYHAAFPLALTSDLLYRLWANFQCGCWGQSLNIPWVAVADLMLSNLCKEVGYGLYEMPPAVRTTLLNQLKANPRFGPDRIRQLAEFLLTYHQQQIYGEDPDLRDLAQAQRWTALAHTQPAKAAQELAAVMAKVSHQDKTELIRMAALVNSLESPLANFKSLLTYAKGMDCFAQGDLSAAAAEFRRLRQRGQQVKIAGVYLPIPATVNAFGAVGAVLRNLTLSLQLPKINANSDQPTSDPAQIYPLQTTPFNFEMVTVNTQGQVTVKRQGESQNFSVDLDGIALEMVKIPAGEFEMGSPADEEGHNSTEHPQHWVTVPAFFMGKYPVTQAQWRAVAALTQINRRLEPDPSRFKGDDLPVETVSWEEAVEFCDRLSQVTRLRYRLPSEAEWEYACRAGTTTPFNFGEIITPNLANYIEKTRHNPVPIVAYREQTKPVGSFGVANAFGLYDMHGNVWEWCEDTWHDNYNNAPTDGGAWVDKNDTRYRLLRGGSWYSNPVLCRSANRNANAPDDRLNFFGFRVSLSITNTLLYQN